MSSRASPVPGIVWVLAAAALWGTTGTAQSLVPSSLSSYWVGALRLGVSGLFFVAWLGWAERGGLRVLVLRALPWPGIAAAAVCMTVYNLSFFAGVRASGVAVGTAIALGSAPVWAGLLQAVVGRQPLGTLWWAGTAVAVAGGVLMILGGGEVVVFTAAGVALCLLAGLSYAAYTLVNKHLVAAAPPGLITGAVFGLAAALAAPLAWSLAGPLVLRVADVAVMAWLGVMATGVAYLLFSHGLRRVSGATAVALALMEAVTAFVLAWAVVGERPGMAAVAGLCVLLAGLGLVIRAELRVVVALSSARATLV
jgi:DME family drug/metabolite transporter